MIKYESLSEAREKRNNQRFMAKMGEPEAIKKEAQTEERRFIIVAVIIIIFALIAIFVELSPIISISSDPRLGILAIFWPYYLGILFIIAIIFSLLCSFTQRKLKKIKNNHSGLRLPNAITRIALASCFAASLIAIGLLCFFAIFIIKTTI